MRFEIFSFLHLNIYRCFLYTGINYKAIFWSITSKVPLSYLGDTISHQISWSSGSYKFIFPFPWCSMSIDYGKTTKTINPVCFTTICNYKLKAIIAQTLSIHTIYVYSTYIHTYMHTYTYIYIHTHIHTHTYTHTHIYMKGN